MNGVRCNITEWKRLDGTSKEPLWGCNRAEKRHLIIPLFYEWQWNKGRIFTLRISSPSSCLAAPEGAGPLSALQFSEREANEETGSRRAFLILIKEVKCMYVQQVTLQICTTFCQWSGSIDLSVITRNSLTIQWMCESEWRYSTFCRSP